MLDPKKKAKIIAKFKTHAQDTGSVEVQIAILTEEIKELTKHLQQHKHDYSSRRGLLKKLGERKRLLRYLEKENEASFIKLTQELKLKISAKRKKEAELKKLLEKELEEEAKKEAENLEEKTN